LSGLLTSIIQLLSQFFVGVLIVLVIMMVLLPRYKRPEREQLTNLVPLPADITQLYLDKVRIMIDAMFKGTFLIAFLEGLAMGLVFFIAGVPYTFLLTTLSMFLALLPMIGISLIAWPIGIILILDGQVAEGVFVIVAFLLFVANIDTVLRPKLVPKEAYLNPALTILSVFGGISLMGFIGIIYGPVIMILLVTSVEVYGKYIMRTDLEPYLAEDGSLDMEKLGLREGEEEQTDSGSTRNFVHRVANLVTSRVTGQNDKESVEK
jgi:predicted PurR-regulated permease PerM